MACSCEQMFLFMNSLTTLATKHLTDIVNDAIRLQPSEHALVIFDTVAPLTRIITDGYRGALPNGEFLDFDSVTPEEVIQKMRSLNEGDLVVLVQSMNFRLNEFRIRIELFARGLKTVEHVHLARIQEPQFPVYIEALAYEKAFYHEKGHGLKKRLDTCSKIVVNCPGTTLTYDTGMEPTKLNIGDYTEMKNVGGTFPIGEVFTEAKDLTKVNGEAMIFGYANQDHYIQIVEPFKVIVKDGILTAPDAPQDFKDILDRIREDEEVIVREFGLGLNRAMGKDKIVYDITAFERQHGMHLSLGAKHAIYAKPGLHRKKGRYHVDVFVDIEKIQIDDEVVYRDGEFHV
ncbi:hypothetical protein A3C09_02290 [Candidatus Uhrbacteria bacterium RIFCSPHIGHO2_02_FULL_47_44]|uniref:Uncharacterized protein n=1 Tax=Candidatus Uhrbacteria bacterium RIFCSPLOWO2_02_FULL_48_18 TaxID=1802408 RepID=A0A1F7V7E1_9BACT|nr:MAG: hypothetical protein A2839_01480 [Candidatus Uhrbacteria bacterium RIFCSPHIGHO2_01_FULL_47_10]OGL71186.1 MAG: hypothetical protein A3C09_02290 [Candidatus Uhrbacteria bacterium RIFCSPHIGHO2_02_FULL_47_44]OGL77253.1 MAG: hypothetical protein A3E97_01125 [Candidatus Uhrbacteria bacterium RIFCSPHIGHO2_12_FULL_47_12]OGL80481.1 MAG: hypothetical protein A3B20_03675 [Candidatus Uhrbacteria bacterium RIFCSPLOWO2_01_FULL_47_17]OGL86341.1 MAG: hypothetical protein A3I41_02155 [Candidatus Uhrbact